MRCSSIDFLVMGLVPTLLTWCLAMPVGAGESPADKPANVPADTKATSVEEINWPNPDQPVVPASDNDAAVALKDILADPMVATLISADEQVDKLRQGFEAKFTSAVIEVRRESLLQVMLTAWWQLEAIKAHRARLGIVVAGDGATGPHYVLCDHGIFAGPQWWEDWRNTQVNVASIQQASLIETIENSVRDSTVNFDDQLAQDSIEHLIINRDGHLLFISPAQAKALARPVMTGLVMRSSLDRTWTAEMQDTSLSEFAKSLAKGCDADLVLAQSETSRNEIMPTITMSIHNQSVNTVIRSISDANHWHINVLDPYRAVCVGISLLFDKAKPQGILKAVTQPADPASTSVVDQMFTVLAGMVPPRPVLILSNRVDPPAPKP